MKDAWNERYAAAEYIYGTTPNMFLRTQLAALPTGRLLLPAEGEGRNAVHAAREGWQVDAVDFSEEGRRKALALAAHHGVADRITYTLADLAHVEFAENTYDAVALVFAHLPAPVRMRVHAACIRALKPGGTLIIEAFTPRQLGNTSGGPKSIDLLYTAEMLAGDAAGMTVRVLEERDDVDLDEGAFHRGPASVVRLVAVR